MNLQHHKKPFVKVCGQTHTSSTDAATAFGASMLGFIFHPRSARSISPERAAMIHTSREVKRVGVFVRQKAPDICRIMQQARLDYAQLHGRQDTADAAAIGTGRIIRVLWPEQCGSAQELQAQIDAWEPFCAFYLVDAGAIGTGGNGRTIDVTRLSSLRFPHPWLLAGGLSPDNIATLLQRCTPDGLDLNSGLESAPGLKSNKAMLRAVRALRGLDARHPALRG